MRNETITDDHLAKLNNQVNQAATDVILLSTHRGKVDETNHKKIQELPGQEYLYE